MTNDNHHIPVLLDSLAEFLNLTAQNNWTVFDGTLGGGGYTIRFLELGFNVIAGDLDESAIQRFQSSLNFKLALQCRLEKGNFADLIESLKDETLDLAVLDLGYSSNQLEMGLRGFSYQKEGELLDLRYDQTQGQPCYIKLAGLQSVDKLWNIIYRYSGEKYSRLLATQLYDLAKSKVKIESPVTVGQAVTALQSAIPAREQRNRNSILSRVWQALRIWTNGEFESLERFLQSAPVKLKPGGFLAIVCFHSLEDKIVTGSMRDLAKPLEIDDFGNKSQAFKLLTPKAIQPSQMEIQANVRSRSATLRILQKL